MLTTASVRRNPLRYLFAISRRAKLANTFTLGPKFVANSVLVGLSSRSRKRLFVNYTNKTGAATRFACRPISTPRSCFCFHITIGKLANKRSNSSVGGNETGTGGLLGHFLARLTSGCVLCLYRVSNKGLRGTVPHRTRTLYTMPVGSGRSIHMSLGVCATRLRGRCTTARPGLEARLSSRSPYGRTVSVAATKRLLETICTIRGKICTVDRSVPKLMRASSGLTSVGRMRKGGVGVIADRHDSVLSSHGSVSRVVHSTFLLKNTRMAANRNCPK